MQARTALSLLIAAGLVLGAAWLYGPGETAPVIAEAGRLVFPGLAPKLPQVARVDIQSKGVTMGIAPAKGKWGLADRGFYPVQQDRLRELLTGLTELRLAEARTSDPAQYGRLGVEDPGPGGTANLVRLLDAQGKPIIELIVGHRRVRTQGNVPETIFIRRPGEAQSWMAEGRLPLDADPQLWVERDIANIAGTSIAKVTSQRGATTLEFARIGERFTLVSPTSVRKLDDYRIEEVSRAMESLTLTDVRAASPPGDGIGTAVFTTTAGMTITARLFKADKDVWAQFTAAGPGAEPLQARIDGWAYQLGAWKEKSFLPTMEDLLAEEPAKPAASDD